MIIDYEIINALAEDCFDGNMLEDLSAYLIDCYDEEPLEGYLSPQCLFSIIQSDINSYKKGEPDVTLRTEFEKLQDKHSELEARNCYMKDFIDYMKMGDKFFEFVEKTHVETNEFVFRYYTL